MTHVAHPLDHTDPKALAAAAEWLSSEGQLEEAARVMALAAQKSDDGQHWATLGMIEHRLGRVDDAIACYERAIARGLDRLAVWANLGEARLDKLCYAQAAEALSRAIALDPGGKDPVSIRARALALKALRELKARAVA